MSNKLGIIDIRRDTKRSSQTSGFNIERFRANIAGAGYLDNNSFEVFIQPPSFLQGASISNQGTGTPTYNITEGLAFRIDQVRAPGISLMSADVNHYGVGPTQKQPFSAQFSEVNISLLGDRYCNFWQFWYSWLRGIFEFNGNSQGLAPSYTSEYKDRYSSVVMIFIYDHHGNVVQKIHLFQAFPTALREIPLAWGDPNLMRFNVSIAYTEYVIENVGVQENEVQNRNLRNSKLADSVIEIGSKLVSK